MLIKANFNEAKTDLRHELNDQLEALQDKIENFQGSLQQMVTNSGGFRNLYTSENFSQIQGIVQRGIDDIKADLEALKDFIKQAAGDCPAEFKLCTQLVDTLYGNPETEGNQARNYYEKFMGSVPKGSFDFSQSTKHEMWFQALTTQFLLNQSDTVALAPSLLGSRRISSGAGGGGGAGGTGGAGGAGNIPVHPISIHGNNENGNANATNNRTTVTPGRSPITIGNKETNNTGAPNNRTTVTPGKQSRIKPEPNTNQQEAASTGTKPAIQIKTTENVGNTSPAPTRRNIESGQRSGDGTVQAKKQPVRHRGSENPIHQSGTDPQGVPVRGTQVPQQVVPQNISQDNTVHVQSAGVKASSGQTQEQLGTTNASHENLIQMSSPSTGQPNEIKSSDNETGDIGQQVPEQDNLEEEVITLEQTAVNQDAAAVNQDTAAVNQDTDEVQHQKTIDVNKFINKLRGATNPNVRLTDEQFLEILQHEPEVQYNDGPAIKQNIFQVLLSKPKALEAFVRCGLNILNQLEDSAEIKRSIKKQFAEKLLAFNTEGDRYTSLANKSEFSCINTLMDAVEQMNKEVMDAVDPMIAPGNQPDTEIMPAVKPGKEIMPAVLGFITSKNVDAGLELLDRLRGNDSLDKFLQDNVEAFGGAVQQDPKVLEHFLREGDFSTLSPFANDYIVSIGNRNPSNMQVNNILKLIAKGDVSEDNNLEVFQNALERVTDVNQSLEGNEPTPLFTQLLSNFTKEANILFLEGLKVGRMKTILN